jgi:hypothetical protein
MAGKAIVSAGAVLAVIILAGWVALSSRGVKMESAPEAAA